MFHLSIYWRLLAYLSKIILTSFQCSGTIFQSGKWIKIFQFLHFLVLIWLFWLPSWRILYKSVLTKIGIVTGLWIKSIKKLVTFALKSWFLQKKILKFKPFGLWLLPCSIKLNTILILSRPSVGGETYRRLIEPVGFIFLLRLGLGVPNCPMPRTWSSFLWLLSFWLKL